jgi:hypothetical protein
MGEVKDVASLEVIGEVSRGLVQDRASVLAKRVIRRPVAV